MNGTRHTNGTAVRRFGVRTAVGLHKSFPGQGRAWTNVCPVGNRGNSNPAVGQLVSAEGRAECRCLKYW